MRAVLFILAFGITALVAARYSIAATPVHSETAKPITEDALTTDVGATEVEFYVALGIVGREYDSGGNRVDRGDLRLASLAVSATYGWRARLDAGIRAEGLKIVRDESGEVADDLGTISFNLKWLFYERRQGGLALSWLPGFTAPVGPSAGDFTKLTALQNFWSIDNYLAVTYVRERLNSSADAGLVLPLSSARPERTAIVYLDAAAGMHLTRWFQPLLEINFAYDVIQGPDGNASIVQLTLGAVFNVTDAFRVDFGLGHGVIGRNQDELAVMLANASLTF